MSTPWGIVTGIFVHKDFDHYAGNMAVLLTFILIFVSVNLPFDGLEQQRRTTLFSWTVFVAAVTANLLWILRFREAPEGAYGASGVVYAAMMMVTMFAPLNLHHHASGLSRAWKINDRSLLVHAVLGVANLVILLFLLSWIVSAPAEFLGVGTGANVLGHGAASLLVLPGPVIYAVWRLRFLGRI